MDLRKKNYRLDKTMSYDQLRSIFDESNSNYGEGIQLQYRVLGKLSEQGNWLSTYLLDTVLIGFVALPDKTIDKHIINPDGTFRTEKVPTLNLYQINPKNFRR
jgi:hypothetical protein